MVRLSWGDVIESVIQDQFSPDIHDQLYRPRPAFRRRASGI